MSGLHIPGHSHDEPAPTPQEESSAPLEAVTAFVVFQQPDGSWIYTNNLDVPLDLQRPAHHHDVLAGCAVVVNDIHIIQSAQVTTQSVLANMQQQAAALRQQMENANLVRNLNLKK